MKFTRGLWQQLEKTRLSGVFKHPNPRDQLLQIYSATLTTIQTFPSDSKYRQSVESITKARMEIIEKANGSKESMENAKDEINGGLIEEVLKAAQDEFDLACKMKEWKPWEQLEVKPDPNQWKYFK